MARGSRDGGGRVGKSRETGRCAKWSSCGGITRGTQYMFINETDAYALSRCTSLKPAGRGAGC